MLFIIGAILAYLLASKPEIYFFQVGGIRHNLILGIFPLIAGIIILIYALVTYYSFSITRKDDSLILKNRRKEISFNINELQAVRVRDAGKVMVWVLFVSVNFYFIYYGLENGLYFVLNHNVGSFEYIFIPILLVWIAGLILILFPRKVIIFLMKDKAIIQKINHLPKDRAFNKLFDEIFDFKETNQAHFTKVTGYSYRLIIGLIFISIFIVSTIIVDVQGIYRPFHDLGFFIPQMIVIFGILMISSSLSQPRKQNLIIKDKTLRIEEISLLTPISGKNLIWIKSPKSLNQEKDIKKSFINLTKFDITISYFIFGGACFLAFKILWNPFLYLPYFDWIDFLIGLIILISLFFYQFEIVTKLDIELNSTLKFRREILLGKNYFNKTNREKTGSFMSKINNYFTDFRNISQTDKKRQFAKILITDVAAIFTISISYYTLGIVFFPFI